MQKRTKIIATIGPACKDKEVLEKMIEGGMNLARINFSHGTHESNGALIDAISKIRKEKNLPIGIIADLQGPRIRVMVENDLQVEKDENVVVFDLSSKENLENENKTIKLDKKDILKCMKEGDEILIEDGKIKLKIIEKKEDSLLSQVLVPGVIKDHKGVNVPDSDLDFGALTQKDEKDLEFAISKKVDFVALSFVGDKEDILSLQNKIKEKNSSAKIISKVERKKALQNIDEIISESDVVMVARGDLGIELPETKVVIFQKEIIEKCLKKNKPVIVATQMLESMIENPLPTRAEVSDVSNAVIDHSDAVMLSGESANGKYPIQAVETMAQIIAHTEASPFDDLEEQNWNHEFSEYPAVLRSAYRMAKDTDSKAILMFSFEGNTPLMLSKNRPEQLMLVATNSKNVFFQTSLIWGVQSFLIEERDVDNFALFLKEKGEKKNLLKKGDKLVLIMGKIPGGKKMRLIGMDKVE